MVKIYADTNCKHICQLGFIASEALIIEHTVQWTGKHVNIDISSNFSFL
jgi:hypothetical protein